MTPFKPTNIPARDRARKNQRKQARPYSPKVDFALKWDMITDEEVDEIYKGNMGLEGNYLINLNSAIPSNPTGTRVRLYGGRRTDILSRRLLGLSDEP